MFNKKIKIINISLFSTKNQIFTSFVNFIQKKPLQFKLAQIIGVITIIIGIVIVALNS